MEKIMQNAGFWVAIWLMANLLFVGLFDVAALFSTGRVSTVTTHIIQWSKSYPFLPFMSGVIMGHLFFPAYAWLLPP